MEPGVFARWTMRAKLAVQRATSDPKLLTSTSCRWGDLGVKAIASPCLCGISTSGGVVVNMLTGMGEGRAIFVADDVMGIVAWNLACSRASIMGVSTGGESPSQELFGTLDYDSFPQTTWVFRAVEG